MQFEAQWESIMLHPVAVMQKMLFAGQIIQNTMHELQQLMTQRFLPSPEVANTTTVSLFCHTTLCPYQVLWGWVKVKSYYGPGVDSASNRNEYQESSWG
jgi:hypothetical protein